MDREPRAFSNDQARLLEDLAAIVVRELEVRLEARQAVREIEARRRGNWSDAATPDA